MAQFVLQENSDGTVNLTKKTQVLAEICGKVKYVNPKNKTLFSIHAEKMDKNFRCILNYPNPFCPLKEGDAIFGIGEYFVDSRYGDTLKLIQPPFVVLGEDKNTIIKSFETALRGTGFGTMKAHTLLDALIEKTGSLINSINTLDKMASYYNYKNNSDTDPIQLYSNVLKEKQMLQLLQWWYKNRNLRRLYLFGLNNKEIRESKIAPEEIYKLCLENPYKIFSLSIDKCDNILARIGKTANLETRTCGEIARKLYEYMESRGWSVIPTNILINMFPDAGKYIEQLRNTFGIKTDLHTVYLPYAYEVELGICDLVNNLLDSPPLPHAMSPHEITYTRNDLSKDQKMVIEKALSDNICIIRGKAGSGKTTIIREIIHNLDEKGIKYRVVSFTGKAVARIREVTNKKEPMTMHMAITLANKSSSNNPNVFTHVIIDEASMVTSELLYEFICKFGTEFRLTLVGDPNQLQTIGFGSMFDQLIKSNVVPTYTLSICHRVGSINSLDNSEALNGILLNANNIVECADPNYNGPPFQFNETDNFKILDGDLNTIKELITILQDCGTPNRNITIICPYNKYLTPINKICQDIYNDQNRFAHDNQGRSWKINDRVMMTENNYKINIMNGDEGIVTDLTSTQVQVTFKDGTVHIFQLDSDSINENENNDEKERNNNENILSTSCLVHSYGVSVHRYQGSECDYVIFYIPPSQPSKFMNRNLLYTGITRAKKLIWMVGDYDTMIRAATTSPAYRCDNLAQRLKDTRTIQL